MKKVIISLMAILVMVSLAAGATYAVFSDSASVTNNTFATGTLEIRANGQPTVTGFSLTNAVPGSCVTRNVTINNFGAPWFAGPSTLTARELVMNTANQGGDGDLFDALQITVETDRGWDDWMPVYTGPLWALSEEDLFSPRWTELLPGHSQDVQYTVCLPITAGNNLQGKTASWNFVFTAYNPDRTP